MRAYTGFARVYDRFMDNVPYEGWADYIEERLRERGICEGLLLDLGCGTGNMTECLSRRGYDMTGIDNSSDMLEAAAEKGEKSGGILYLLQDMREFELYGTVRAVVSVCDSLNYILREEELIKVFKLVNNYLDPGGIFLFDLNTEYKYRELLGERTIAENREECAFIWENYYDEKERINEYELTIFLEEGRGLYRKYQETHYQRAYSLDRIKAMLEEAGLEFLEACDGFTREPAFEKSERIVTLARERGKA